MASSTDAKPIEPERLLSHSGLAIDRLPLLRAVFEQFRSYLVDHLGEISVAQVVASLEEIGTFRAGEALDGGEVGAVTAFFESSRWDSGVAAKLDRKLLLGLVEAALGGDRPAEKGEEEEDEEEDDDGRPLSRFEMRLTAAICEKTMAALADAFEPISEPDLHFQKLERRRDPTGLGPEGTKVMVARYRVESLYRGGDLKIIIPQKALLPMREKLSRPPSTILKSDDPRWSSQIRREVGRTGIELQAVLAERQLTLGEVSNFQVGQVIPLSAGSYSRCKLTCKGQTLFHCALGQTDGNFTLRIEEAVEPEVKAAASRAGA